MALIKCGRCNKEISDKSTSCIHCGFPVEHSIVDTSVEVHVCPECGKEFTDSRCMNCGYLLVPVSNISNNSSKKRSRFNAIPLLKSLLATLVAVVLLNIVDGGDLFEIPEIAIPVILIVFISAYAAFSGNSSALEELDDIQARTNPDSYKRAMYRQMKKNNKK